ncbi:MAG: MFS transporter, partial [Thermoanaerobaculia bacterium]
MEPNPPPADASRRIERTLRHSILDGIGYSVMVGAGETYFIPYAIFLGSSNLVLGLLVAFPIFLGSLSQVLSEKLLRILGSRKRLIALAALLQGLTLLPMLLVHFSPAYRGQLLLACVSAYWVFGLVLGPSWSSLMGDLVEERRRGEYFGRRNRCLQISIFLSLSAAGAVLWACNRTGEEYLGFAAIFGLAFLARVVSFVFLLLHWEPPMASPPHGRTVSMVIETLRDRDHRLLVLYLSLMNLGVYLSAPFFSTYMLRPPAEHGLGWSYAKYTAIHGIAMVFKFLFLPLWGRASDRFGTRKCLTLSAWIVATLPLFWLTRDDRPLLHLALIC